jgi:hypothetical protein
MAGRPALAKPKLEYGKGRPTNWPRPPLSLLVSYRKASAAGDRSPFEVLQRCPSLVAHYLDRLQIYRQGCISNRRAGQASCFVVMSVVSLIRGGHLMVIRARELPGYTAASCSKFAVFCTSFLFPYTVDRSTIAYQAL